MSRMLSAAFVGAVFGFFVLLTLFYLSAPRGPEVSLWVAFSIMGAIPVAAIAALFAAVSILREELRETRREMKHWQSTFQVFEDVEKPSTHIKPGPPGRDI